MACRRAVRAAAGVGARPRTSRCPGGAGGRPGHREADADLRRAGGVHGARGWRLLRARHGRGPRPGDYAGACDHPERSPSPRSRPRACCGAACGPARAHAAHGTEEVVDERLARLADQEEQAKHVLGEAAPATAALAVPALAAPCPRPEAQPRSRDGGTGAWHVDAEITGRQVCRRQARRHRAPRASRRCPMASTTSTWAAGRACGFAAPGLRVIPVAVRWA